MNRILAWIAMAAAAGCAAPPPPPAGVEPGILGAVGAALERKPQKPPAAVEEALLPPPRMEMPEFRGRPIEPRFDLSVSNAPASQVFMSLVSGTRYSMLLHPGLMGTISVNLKDVTIPEALDSLRELYGYDYKVDGARIFVQPAGLQVRIFQVNYLPGQRRGTSEVRVHSGAVSDTSGGGTSGAAQAGSAPAPGAQPGSRALESSRVSTTQQADFWSDLRTALTALVGGGEGRSVVVTPHSGVVAVRAFPQELRAVEQYLRATRISVERQVMLEAKIVEVTLAENYQAGINWAAFRNSGPNVAIGQTTTFGNSETVLGTRGQAIGSAPLRVDSAARVIAGTSALGLAAGNPAGAVFGLALQTSNFAALLQFLESQGNVQVLSSPRIATLNNQKAVLKVGTDEFFVTNVTTTIASTTTGTSATPTVTVQPFFSGILLDVTPQIDEMGNIILHIHPAVSEVSESTRVINLGAQIATITLPLAKSAVSETDTIVRVTDGNIVAIGGLMSVDIKDHRGGMPGVSEGGLGNLFRNTSRTSRKKELVILLKPTVIQTDREWQTDLRETQQRFEGLGRPAAPRQQDGQGTR